MNVNKNYKKIHAHETLENENLPPWCLEEKHNSIKNLIQLVIVFIRLIHVTLLANQLHDNACKFLGIPLNSLLQGIYIIHHKYHLQTRPENEAIEL